METSDKHIEVIPAILEQDYFAIEEAMMKVVDSVPLVQIDVIDGQFVKGIRTWPYINVPDEHLNALLREEESFPFQNLLDFEADLMVADPLSVWQDWITLGAKRIIAHIEAIKDPYEFIYQVKELGGSHDAFFLVESGIAFDVQTPLKRIEDIVPHVDVVQCMGIREIGKQGEVFDERVIEKIKEIKERFPHAIISVDGGIDEESAPLLVEAGVDRFISGSFIFGSDDVEDRIELLRDIGYNKDND